MSKVASTLTVSLKKSWSGKGQSSAFASEAPGTLHGEVTGLSSAERTLRYGLCTAVVFVARRAFGVGTHQSSVGTWG